MYNKIVDGVEVPMTEEEIKERQAEEAAWELEKGQPSLIDQLNQAFESLAPETQADLAPLKAAVKLELDQGRHNIARLIIERAQVPAELESLRAQMLEAFK